MYLSLVSLVGGLIYLLIGADLLVRGAVALARRARVPPIVVALTVVALGTSLPELVVSVHAALTGYPGIALGNAVGSNIANVLLVGGGAAIIYPLANPGGSIRRDTAVMMVASLVLLAFCLTGNLGRTAGVVFLLGLLAVMVPTVQDGVRAHYESEGKAPMEIVLGLPGHRPVIFLFILTGLVFLPIGARLVVDAAVEIAVRAGISETVVGLTIIAFSTSLPELATTMVAAHRKETEVAIGTLVGSNTFNILAILGVAGVVAPGGIAVPPLFPFLDLPVMLAASLFITILAWTRRPLGRKAGILLSTGYLAYLAALLVFA
ncbi:MAG: calcium/sodium antiporter [Longimicrobiales bacterium]